MNDWIVATIVDQDDKGIDREAKAHLYGGRGVPNIDGEGLTQRVPA